MTNNELYELEELSEPIPVTDMLDLLALATELAWSETRGTPKSYLDTSGDFCFWL